MEPVDPSFADEYAVLVFDVRRAVVSLPFQFYRLQVLVEATLRTKDQKKFSTAVLQEFRTVLPAIFTAF